MCAGAFACCCAKLLRSASAPSDLPLQQLRATLIDVEPYEDDFEDKLESARSILVADQESALWEANELINRALSLRPSDREAWMLKAQVLSALDDDHAALAAIEMALASSSVCAEALYWRAAILGDLDRRVEALASLERAFGVLTADDNWLLEDLFCEKASTLEVLDRKREAIATYERGLANFPGSTQLGAGLAPLQRSRRANWVVLDGGLERVRDSE